MLVRRESGEWRVEGQRSGYGEEREGWNSGSGGTGAGVGAGAGAGVVCWWKGEEIK